MTGIINDDASRGFSRLLDSYGLDEENRRKRTECQVMHQLLMSWGYESVIGGSSVCLSGSSYEATTLDGLSSDVDTMMIQHHFRVIDNIQKWKPDQDMYTYMMDDTGCYGAFVKLYLLSKSYPGPLFCDEGSVPYGHVCDEDGKILLLNDYCSKAVRGQVNFDLEPHGPALTPTLYSDIHENDYVFTLMCDSFPRQAAWWKTRQTNQSLARISRDIIDEAKHCYLVGVGNKGSPTEKVEWRISFSYIENQLVHAWNNVQYKCYIMMKFIHKDLIKPNVPNCVLCSYHFKTILMWMVEEYPTEIFTKSKFCMCLKVCLINLASCVRRRSLPHYFVKGCNLFYKRMNDESVGQMTSVLENIICLLPNCLFNIKRRDLGKNLQAWLLNGVPLGEICDGVYQDRREHDYLFDLSAENISIFSTYINMKTIILEKHHRKIFKSLLDLQMLLQRKSRYQRRESERFILFIQKDILCSLGLQLVRYSDHVTNKSALTFLRTGFGCIKKGINESCIKTCLEIAGHLVMAGKHRGALELLGIAETRIDACTICFCNQHVCNSVDTPEHNRAVIDNKPSIVDYFKCYCALSVTYGKQDLPQVPRALVSEMFRTTVTSPPVLNPEEYDWYNQAIVHCPLYLYYLQFLCFRALGRFNGCERALHNMILASKELERYPGTHTETNHNIIGNCFRIHGEMHRAYKEYRRSLLKKKFHNAALWHVAVLLRKSTVKSKVLLIILDRGALKWDISYSYLPRNVVNDDTNLENGYASSSYKTKPQSIFLNEAVDKVRRYDLELKGILAKATGQGRVKDQQQKRILDDAARRRRQRKALEALEQDNFQDDPHGDLKMSKKAPKFEESMETAQPVSKKKRKNKSDHFKFKYKKSFSALLEEEHMLNKEPPNYLSACVPPSRFPERRFCAVCGFPSNYTCVQCGARYCSVKCLGTHQDTRCLKWTA